MKNITSISELDNIIECNNKVILQFSASWCGPCQRIKPHMEKLSHDNKEVVFCYIDIDSLGDIAQEYGVQGVPSFFFMKDKKVTDNIVGANQGAIDAAFQKLKEC